MGRICCVWVIYRNVHLQEIAVENGSTVSYSHKEMKLDESDVEPSQRGKLYQWRFPWIVSFFEPWFKFVLNQLFY